MRAQLARPALDAVRADGACLHRQDGVVCAVVESGDLDVPALDVSRRAAAVASFARLCRTLDCSLQILVQVRRWRDRGGDDEHHAAEQLPHGVGTLASTLRDATAAHRRRVLRARPAFRRRILFVPNAGSIDDVERATRLVVDMLHAAGTTAHRLRDDALRTCVREAWGAADPAATGGWLHPPPWMRHPTHAALGDLLLRAVVLRRLPGVAVEPGWMAPLLDVRAECDISLHVTPVGVADAMSAIGRRLRTLRADQLVELDRESYGDAGLEVGVDSALDLRGRLARNEGRAARIGLVAVARAPDLATLDLAGDAVRTAAGATLAHCEPAHLQHLEAAAGAWPLGHDHIGAGKLVDTTALATCVPWTSSVCDDPGGYALGTATATGTPVRVAPFDTTHHGNANVAVIAASGQGKSYAIGTLVLEAAGRGVGSVIVDPEGEYERIVRALDGDYVSIAPGCGTALNIFDVGDDGRGETVAAVVELIGVLCGGALDEVERAHVDAAATRAIERATAEDRVPVLGDCLDHLDTAAPRAALVLRRFCSGPSVSCSTAPPRRGSAHRWWACRCATSRASWSRQRRWWSPSGSGHWCGATAASATWSSTRSACSAPIPRCAPCWCSWPGAAASTAPRWWWPPRTRATCWLRPRARWSPPTRPSCCSAATAAPRPR